jgi:predicted O-methyltransferase YrrM
MPQPLWTAVDRYLADTLLPPDDALNAALAANAAAGLPSIDVSALQGKMLQVFAHLVQARRILEVGALGGYSTLWMAYALPPGGIVVSLEIDPHRAAIAKANISRAGFAQQVDIRPGPALETLALMIAVPEDPFDLIFIDADKPNNPLYLELVLQVARPGTLLLFDNIIRDGALIDPNSPDPSVQGQRALLAAIAANPHLSATALQTVGSKGYDGFAMAIVLR